MRCTDVAQYASEAITDARPSVCLGKRVPDICARRMAFRHMEMVLLKSNIVAHKRNFRALRIGTSAAPPAAAPSFWPEVLENLTGRPTDREPRPVVKVQMFCILDGDYR